MAAGNNEVEDGIDSIVGVGKVGGIVEPSIVEEGFTNIEVVDTSRERVESDDAVHIIIADGVVGDHLEERLLISVVELRTGDIHPRGISSGDSQSVDTDAGELINGRGVEERCVACFHYCTAFVTKRLAKVPLVGGIGAVGIPPDRVMSLLLLKPRSKIGTVGLECSPIDETSSGGCLEGNSVRGCACSGTFAAHGSVRGGSDLGAHTRIGRTREAVAVRDGILVSARTGGAGIGCISGRPGLGVQLAVLANGNTVA